MAQLVRALASHARGRWFESSYLHHIATLFLIQCLYWEQSGFIIQKARKTGTFRAFQLFYRPLPTGNALQKAVQKVKTDA
jgi:hypothetical protein